MMRNVIKIDVGEWEINDVSIIVDFFRRLDNSDDVSRFGNMVSALSSREAGLYAAELETKKNLAI